MITPANFYEKHEIAMIEMVLTKISGVLKLKPKEVRNRLKIRICLNHFINDAINHIKSLVKQKLYYWGVSTSQINGMKKSNHPVYQELLRQLHYAGWKANLVADKGKNKKEKLFLIIQAT